MTSKISLYRFILIASLLLINTMVLADGKWQIARDDDFARDDGVESDLKDIFFVDEKSGWVVGGNLILQTADGGETWKTISTGAGRQATVHCVYFRNAKCGIIAATAARRGRRRPGAEGGPPAAPGGEAGPGGGGRARPGPGVTPGQAPGGGQTPGPDAGPPPGFSRRGGGSVVLITADGGQTWAQHGARAGQLADIQMVDENIGYAVGATNTMVKTTDGGATWASIIRGQRARTGETRHNLDGVYFVSPQIGWIVGSFGAIMHTRDGGDNWEQQKVKTSTDLKAVSFVSEKEGWVVGNEGAILHTADAGKTWEEQKSNTYDALHSVVFVDKNIGWACGDFGTVVHTTDSGKTWKRENTNTSTNLRRISAIKKSDDGKHYCWVVGEWGLIIRYVPTNK